MMLQRILLISFFLAFSSPAFAGFDEGKQAYDKKDWLTAIKELRPLAERGDDRAMILLANMYAGGYGVVPSHEESLALYKRAAIEKSNPQAMDAVGAAYVSATGVDQNLATALEWFHRSAKLGDQMGAFFYASILVQGNKTAPNKIQPDPYAAYKWFKIAAANPQNPTFQQYSDKIAQGIIAKKMLTPEEIVKVEKEVAAWKPIEAKDLGPVPVDPPQTPKKPVPVPEKESTVKSLPPPAATDKPLMHSVLPQK